MKYTIIVASIVIATAQTARPADVDKFDLNCKGTITMHIVDTEKDSMSPWVGNIHIYLLKRLFCLDDCRTAENIADIEPGSLILRSSLDAFGREDRIAVDRKTGDYMRSVKFVSSRKDDFSQEYDTYKAECDVSSFTNLPKTLF